MGSPPKLPIMIVPAGDLRPKAFGRIGLPCPSTTRRGGTQAPRDKNLSEPLEARTTASPSRLPWAVKAAEVTPCCPPPGDQWGSIPQGSSPLPQIQIHAISINTYPQGCRMGASSVRTGTGSYSGTVSYHLLLLRLSTYFLSQVRTSQISMYLVRTEYRKHDKSTYQYVLVRTEYILFCLFLYRLFFISKGYIPGTC